MRKNIHEFQIWSLCLFYAASFTAVTMISHSALNPVFVAIRFLSYGLLGILVLLGITGTGSWRQMLNRLLQFFKENPILDVVLVVAVLSCLYRRAVEPVLLVMLMVLARQMGIRKVIWCFFWTSTVCYILTVLMAVTGILPNLSFLRDDVTRLALGFIYPLEAHSVFYLTGLAGLFLYWRKSRWILEVGFVLLSSLLYAATKARFSWVLTLVTALLFLIGANVSQKKMHALVQTRWFICGMAVFAAAMFLVPGILAYNFQWGNDMYDFLNHLVNDRLMLGRKAFAFIPLYPFGYPVEWVGYGGILDPSGMGELWATYNYVDCSYIKNMFDYGYVFLFFEAGFYAWILIHYSRKGDWPMVWAAICVMLLGLFEARLVQVAINPFVLAGGGLLFWKPWKKKTRNQQIRA